MLHRFSQVARNLFHVIPKDEIKAFQDFPALKQLPVGFFV